VLDFEMADALAAAFSAIERDGTVKVVLFSGAGRAFMGGGDLTVFQRDLMAAPKTVSDLIGKFHESVRSIRNISAPVIAAVQGAAAGGGFGMAMACDLVIAADDARFVPAYTRIGTSPDGGTTWSLARLLGARRAMEVLMLGEPLGAQAALTSGLVNKVVPRAELDDAAAALAARVAEGPALALANVKRLVRQAALVPLDQQLEDERAGFMAAAATADFREGITAFFERRPPVFGKDDGRG
jgi:2-(1,2-epoxy-1,2-dihydrophenyl)acetyl-CoA isomerase